MGDTTAEVKPQPFPIMSRQPHILLDSTPGAHFRRKIEGGAKSEDDPTNGRDAVAPLAAGKINTYGDYRYLGMQSEFADPPPPSFEDQRVVIAGPFWENAQTVTLPQTLQAFLERRLLANFLAPIEKIPSGPFAVNIDRLDTL